MKFLSMFKTADKAGFIPVIPPCEGYYTNILVQVLVGVAGAVAENPIVFYMGTNIDRDALDELVDANEFNVLPDLRNNAFYKLMQITKGLPNLPFFKAMHYHFGSRKLHIDEDDLMMIYTKSFSGTLDLIWCIQGQFVPKQGSMYKFEQQILAVTEAANYDADPITIPISIENVLIEMIIDGPTTIVAVSGTFKLKLFDPQQLVEVISSAGGTVYGDIFRGATGAQHRMNEKNTLLNVDYSFVVGGNNHDEGSKVVPFLKAGSILTFDHDSPLGAAAVATLKLRISGYVSGKHYSKVSTFYQSAWSEDLNDREEHE